jgi:uncharacterized protein (DUF1015 family)
MPPVRPFAALGYALERYGASHVPDRVRTRDEADAALAADAADAAHAALAADAAHPGLVADLTDLVCPPYDVIDSDLQRALEDRDEHNAVRLELSSAADPYAAAARTLATWVADGTLARPARPCFYYYSHAKPAAPDDPVVSGVLARVLLEPFGDGVRAHEHTMPGPRADRLALLQATGTQLSPILALYFDRSERYRHVMSRAWRDEWRARDGDGLLHTCAAVEPDERMAGYLSRQRLFIADGHHRYETALAHQAQVRSDPAHAGAPAGSLGADWVMMVLVNAELEELQVRSTHRLVRGVDAGPLRALAAGPDPLFTALPVAPSDLPGRLERTDVDGTAVFGMLLPGDEAFLLVADADALEARMRREAGSTAVRRLDTAALQAAILGDRLGLDPTTDAGERILYTKDPDDALARVRSGAVQAAFLVRPTTLEQLAAVALAGDVMPEKSTYFYPKLLTGMGFWSLEDE